MSWWQKVVRLYHNLFNIKFAIISAVFNSGVVMVVNKQHSVSVVVAAGAVQAVSSFFSTGVTARVVQHFSPIKDPLKSYLLGSFVPAALTFILSICGHILNNTPELLMSVFPATLMSFVTSFVTNFITRRGYLRPPDYPTT